MKKTTLKRLAAALGLSVLLTGCSKSSDLDMEAVQMNLDAIAIPDQVQVVALGEASHGVKEYQELKAEVFQTLVRDRGCRTFIIEGDFGNGLKVDEYIHGGEGTAREAAALIGFRIYRTKEMEELLKWMRSYNETAPEGEDLHFYGMDMQKADNSKDYLFRILRQVDPGLSAQYEETFAFLNDNDIYDLSTDAFARALPDAEKLLARVDQIKEQIVETCGQEAFEFARECANSIYNCCDIRKSDGEYNEVRDRHMAEKVHWFLEHGDGSMLFINGHNGHIGRANSTLFYNCMGKRLAEDLGDGYFAIGTDARVTAFQSQTEDGFKEASVENANALNDLACRVEGSRYYIDLKNASSFRGWDKLLSRSLTITSLNVGGIIPLKMFYTSKIVPDKTFDAMIVYDQVRPTTLSDS